MKTLTVLFLSMLALTVCAQTNLIENGDFETGEFHQNGQNWFLGGSSTSKAVAAAETAHIYDGSYSAKISHDTPAGYSTVNYFYKHWFTGLTAGVYTFSFYAKAIDANTDAKTVKVSFNTGPTSGESIQTAHDVFNLTEAYEKYEVQFTIVAGETQKISLFFGQEAGTYYIDNVVFEEETNILENGGFELGIFHLGGQKWFLGGGSTTKAVEAAEEAHIYEGSYSAKISHATDGSAYEVNYTYNNLFADLTPGDVYILSFYAKAIDAESSTKSVKVSFKSGPAGGPYVTLQQLFTLTETYVQYEYEYTIPADPTEVQQFNLWFGAQAGTYYLDNVELKLKDEGTATGQKELLDTPSLSVFPNPVSTELCVNGIESNTAFCIYRLDGKEMVSGRISEGEMLDVADLTNGYYILSLTEAGNKQHIKFIKQ